MGVRWISFSLFFSFSLFKGLIKQKCPYLCCNWDHFKALVDGACAGEGGVWTDCHQCKGLECWAGGICALFRRRCCPHYSEKVTSWDLSDKVDDLDMFGGWMSDCKFGPECDSDTGSFLRREEVTSSKTAAHCGPGVRSPRHCLKINAHYCNKSGKTKQNKFMSIEFCKFGLALSNTVEHRTS